jgi:hypothetical protein
MNLVLFIGCILEKVSDGLNFDGLIGCDSVRKVLMDYRATILMGRDQGKGVIENGQLELNFQFVGPPGNINLILPFHINSKLYH